MVNVQFVSQKELNRIADQTKKARQQNTKIEYGKANCISSKTHDIKGLSFDCTVLIKKGMSKKETQKVLKHELKHAKRTCH
jgi:hypothetical protein